MKIHHPVMVPSLGIDIARSVNIILLLFIDGFIHGLITLLNICIDNIMLLKTNMIAESNITEYTKPT